MTNEQIRAELAEIAQYQQTCSARCIGGSKFNRLSQRSNELTSELKHRAEESAYDFVDRMIRKHGTCES